MEGVSNRPSVQHGVSVLPHDRDTSGSNVGTTLCRDVGDAASRDIGNGAGKDLIRDFAGRLNQVLRVETRRQKWWPSRGMRTWTLPSLGHRVLSCESGVGSDAACYPTGSLHAYN